MYYGEVFRSYEKLKQKVEACIHYYNNERMKQKLVSINKTVTLRGSE
ncbi:IS3 family transposase [Bacillus badius]